MDTSLLSIKLHCEVELALGIFVSEVLKSAIFVIYQQVATYDKEDELLSKEQKIIREDNISK